MSTGDNRPASGVAPSEVPDLVETTSPSGMDLRPEPEKAVRISKKAGACVIAIGASVLAVFAYGGLRRQHEIAQAAQGDGHKKVEPAHPDDFQQGVGSAAAARRVNPRPTPTDAAVDPNQLEPSSSNLPSERVVVKNAPAARQASATAPPRPAREATPEERAIASAYAAEQQARLAPTGIRARTESGTEDRMSNSPAPADDPSSLQSLARALSGNGTQAAGPNSRLANGTKTDYDDQNLQNQKEDFLEKGRLGNVREDYLKFTRTPPLSRFEIKTGWEIPAILEQSLNSDLPGELKALVMSNVYDTATGLYLLIPQGSRLVGNYNSRIGFGQNGVQVAWHRVIFPDGSSIDLNGMEGLDAQGNAGLRDKVDHHYRQLFGFAVLTSMFDAALAITQNRQQSVLVYPSVTQESESAAGREVSQLGTQITRKNLNVQPTIKISAGYKFNVRVNRDILFEDVYRPSEPIGTGTPNPGQFGRSTR